MTIVGLILFINNGDRATAGMLGRPDKRLILGGRSKADVETGHANLHSWASIPLAYVNQSVSLW
jgi:hypothetical protein